MMTASPAFPSPRLSEAAVGSYETRYILVYSKKGGVGKTALSMHLGATLSVTMRPDRPDNPPVAVASIDEQNTPARYVAAANRAGIALPISVYRMDRDPTQLLQLKGRVRYVLVDAGGHLKGNTPLEVVLNMKDPETGRLLLDCAIVPMEVWDESWEPTEATCEEILKPRGIPFVVVINKYDARKATQGELSATVEFIDQRGWNRTPSPVRMMNAMSRASNTGLLVPDFPSTYARKDGTAEMLTLASAAGLHTATFAGVSA
jgi:chromosome partitioning protein